MGGIRLFLTQRYAEGKGEVRGGFFEEIFYFSLRVGGMGVDRV